MDGQIFPERNQLPELIQDMVKETGLDAMAPGETTWSVPWMLCVSEEGQVFLNPSGVDRDKTPGGTVTLKLIKDFDGVYVDATALDHKAVLDRLKPGGGGSTVGDKGERVAVGGVLYPLIERTNGLEPKAVSKFNTEQQRLRKKFADYYKQTYGMNYVFAEYEAHASSTPSYGSMGSLATGSKRWGRSK